MRNIKPFGGARCAFVGAGFRGTVKQWHMQSRFKNSASGWNITGWGLRVVVLRREIISHLHRSSQPTLTQWGKHLIENSGSRNEILRSARSHWKSMLRFGTHTQSPLFVVAIQFAEDWDAWQNVSSTREKKIIYSFFFISIAFCFYGCLRSLWSCLSIPATDARHASPVLFKIRGECCH